MIGTLSKKISRKTLDRSVEPNQQIRGRSNVKLAMGFPCCLTRVESARNVGRQRKTQRRPLRKANKIVNHFLEPFRVTLADQFNIAFMIDNGGLQFEDWLRIDFDQRHESQSDSHVDICVRFTDHVGETHEFWDCVVGFGSERSEAIANAAHLWSSTTAAAIFEVFAQKGDFATHYAADDPEGVLGWHTIWGPLLGFGNGDSGEMLQNWALNAPLLSRIVSQVASKALPAAAPHGIKLFFGGEDIAEVRVNGEVDEEASASLLQMDWPRLEDFGVLRTYAILLHKG